jgi:hypothetical protein
MRPAAKLLLCLALLTLARGVTAQEAVKGEWFTEPGAGLAAAAKAKRPVLAVAMDHG